MDQFTEMAVVIGISDFTNFRFPAKVSDFIVIDNPHVILQMLSVEKQMFDG